MYVVCGCVVCGKMYLCVVCVKWEKTYVLCMYGVGEWRVYMVWGIHGVCVGTHMVYVGHI